MSRENLHLLPGSVSISAPWHLGASIRHRPGGWEWMLLATSGPSHHGGATLWWHRHHFLHQLSSRFFSIQKSWTCGKGDEHYWSREKSSFSLKSLVYFPNTTVILSQKWSWVMFWWPVVSRRFPSQRACRRPFEDTIVLHLEQCKWSLAEIDWIDWIPAVWWMKTTEI